MNHRKSLHVVFGQSNAGNLRHALAIAGRRELVVGYPDNLAYGPINPPDPSSRVDWQTRVLGFERDEWDWLADEAERFWKQARAEGVRQIVWLSKWDIVEYAGFLEFVWQLADTPFEVVDLTDVKVRRPERTGDEHVGPAFGVGRLHPEIVAREKLWGRSRIPTPSEVEGWTREWSQLREDNAALRVVGEQGLASAPLSYFDEGLMSYAAPEWQPAIRLIGSQMAFGTGHYQQAGDVFLLSRIVQGLVGSGQLELRMPATSNAIRVWRKDLPLDDARLSEVRLSASVKPRI